MNKNLFLISGVCAILLFACNEKPAMPAISYPPTAKVDQTDLYFGTSVADPYRWLENDTAPDVKAWVKSQNKVTFAYLDKIPFRSALRKRLEELYNYARISSPQKEGENYFFYKNEGLQNQSVIYIQKGLEGTPEVFVDPNKLSAKGTTAVALAGFSEDHRYVALSVKEAGSDWTELRVMEVETRKELSDRLKWVKFSEAEWYKDGFFYSRYPEPAKGKKLSGASEYHAVYYHKLGDPQEKDILIYNDPKNPNRYHNLSLTEDKRFMILYISTGTDGFETWYKKTDLLPGGFQALFSGFEHKSSVIDNVGDKLLVLTDIGAPKYQLVSIDPADPTSSSWEKIIPEKEETLEGVTTAGGKLFAQYLKNACTQIIQCDYDGKNAREIALPTLGTGSVAGGNKSDKEVFYLFTSYTFPTSIYRYDIATGASTLFFRPEVKFNPEDYETRQVFYPSKDGTLVSMFITHKKGLTMDGTNPTYLYAYGGFNVNLTPGFSTAGITLLERGFVMAVPNLRGGGEYGEEWHKAGMLLKKQNVFDDYISAAEYLIQEKYTSSAKLAIAGGSNGGLLVGAAITQRPELFRVALPAVGVMDMLRYHKFTVGWGWVPEYGCADSNEAEFKNLYGYSPLHNLKEGVQYPATLITTADHDDRVVPAHSFKFAARIQEVQAGPFPVLIRIDTDAGHGAGKPIAKILDEDADEYAFMCYELGLKE